MITQHLQLINRDVEEEIYFIHGLKCLHGLRGHHKPHATELSVNTRSTRFEIDTGLE